MLRQEYTILQGFVALIQELSRVWLVLIQLESFATMNLEYLKKFMRSIFPVEYAVKDELARHFLHLIFNVSVKSTNKLDRAGRLRTRQHINW